MVLSNAGLTEETIREYADHILSIVDDGKISEMKAKVDAAAGPTDREELLVNSAIALGATTSLLHYRTSVQKSGVHTLTEQAREEFVRIMDECILELGEHPVAERLMEVRGNLVGGALQAAEHELSMCEKMFTLAFNVPTTLLSTPEDTASDFHRLTVGILGVKSSPHDFLAFLTEDLHFTAEDRAVCDCINCRTRSFMEWEGAREYDFDQHIEDNGGTELLTRKYGTSLILAWRKRYTRLRGLVDEAKGVSDPAAASALTRDLFTRLKEANGDHHRTTEAGENPGRLDADEGKQGSGNAGP